MAKGVVVRRELNLRRKSSLSDHPRLFIDSSLLEYRINEVQNSVVCLSIKRHHAEDKGVHQKKVEGEITETDEIPFCGRVWVKIWRTFAIKKTLKVTSVRLEANGDFQKEWTTPGIMIKLFNKKTELS